MVTSWEAFVGAALAFIFLTIVVAWVFIYHKRQNKSPLSFHDVLESLKQIDTRAIFKLFDPMEEARLRQSVTRIEFGKIQSARLAEARNHFRAMLANANALQELAYRYLHQKDEPNPHRTRQRLCRQRGQYRDKTGRAMAEWLLDVSVTVKMPARAALLTLFLWKRLRILDRVLMSPNLADLKDVLNQTLEAYADLREAALLLARYSEPGIELELSTRL